IGGRYRRHSRRSAGTVHDDADGHVEVRRFHGSNRFAQEQTGFVEGLFLRRDPRAAGQLIVRLRSPYSATEPERSSRRPPLTWTRLLINEIFALRTDLSDRCRDESVLCVGICII